MECRFCHEAITVKVTQHTETFYKHMTNHEWLTALHEQMKP